MPCGCPYWQDTRNRLFILDQWVHFQQALEGICFMDFSLSLWIGKSIASSQARQVHSFFYRLRKQTQRTAVIGSSTFRWLGQCWSLYIVFPDCCSRTPSLQQAVFSFQRTPICWKDGLPRADINFIVLITLFCIELG